MRNKLSLVLFSILLTTALSAQTLPQFQATVVPSASFSPSCFVATLSDNGTMAGTCDPFGSYAGGIVVWRNGVATSDGKLPKGTYAQANGINSFGVVTGEADTGDSRPHTFVTYKGGLLEVKDIGANDRGIGITDTGVVYGDIIKGFDGQWVPALWAAEAGRPDRYRVTYLPLYNDGGVSTSFGAYLQASNKGGQAAGWLTGSVIGQIGGFWNNDAAHTVSPLYPVSGGNHAIASGINDIGQAVGTSGTSVLLRL